MNALPSDGCRAAAISRTGDFLIRRDGFSFYFPLATGLLVSLILTLLLWLFRK